MVGFFNESTFLKDIKFKRPIVAKCGLCRLHKGCESPFMKPSGKGKRKILIVGEAPGEDEDDQGKPFVGRSGKLLRRTLKRVKINMKRDCVLTNSLICRPPGNAKPTDNQIDWCNANLQNTIKEHKPEVILTVGEPALQAVLKGIWDHPLGRIGPWVGWEIPLQEHNCWVVPTYHPSYVLRNNKKDDGSPKLSPIPKLFYEHIKQASKLEGRPWKKVPDWESEIEPITDDFKASFAIEEFIRRGGPIATDLETDCLKPDMDGNIVTASVCWRGERTIAFPWGNKLSMASYKKLMESDCPKIGQNNKFEDRWLHRHGIKPRNWVWDTMVQGRVMNIVTEVNLEFLNLVMLGFAPYSFHISEFLKAKGTYAKNRVKQIDWNLLLIYNGLDSLTSYKLMQKQRKYFGYPKL